MRCRTLIFLASVVLLTTTGCTSDETPTGTAGAPKSLAAGNMLTSGACCLSDGTCSEMTALDCNAASGSYQGDSTVCTPDPCPPPPPAEGACCLQDGTCVPLAVADCAAIEGAYQGDNVTCDPNPCPPSPPPQALGGCALKYWKTHRMAWQPTGHHPQDRLRSEFVFPPQLRSLGTDTFMHTLQNPGGCGATGAAMLLLRNAVVAVLNSSHPDVNYPVPESEIVGSVNSALASMNRKTMLETAHTIDLDNSLVCPLH